MNRPSGLKFDGFVVRPHYHHAMTGDPGGGFDGHAGAVAEDLRAIRPVSHPAGAQQYVVAFLNRNALLVERLFAVVNADWVGTTQALNTVQTGDGEEHAAG